MPDIADLKMSRLAEKERGAEIRRKQDTWGRQNNVLPAALLWTLRVLFLETVPTVRMKLLSPHTVPTPPIGRYSMSILERFVKASAITFFVFKELTQILHFVSKRNHTYSVQG